MRNRYRLAVVSLLSVVLAAACIRHRNAEEHAKARAAARLEQTIASLRSAPHDPAKRAVAGSVAAKEQLLDIEVWNAPFAQVEARLRRLAETGDADAAAALGAREGQCWTTLHAKTRAQLLEEFQEDIAGEDAREDHKEFSAARRRNIEQQHANRITNYDGCNSVGEARLADFIKWLEYAGRAGNAHAQVDFARYAFAEWPTTTAIVSGIEEAARRRALARGWIESLVGRGNENALVLYTAALEGDTPLYPRDPARAATYRYVLDLVQNRRVGRFDQRWAEGPYRGKELTDTQWESVRIEGHRIFDASFRSAPLYPQ